MAERKLVRDLMSVGVQTCSLDTPIQQIANFLVKSDLDCVVVLDEEGHAQGVVDQDDMVKAYASDDWSSLKAEDILKENVPQIPPDLLLSAAAQLMRDMKVRSAFMMHHAGGINYSAGVITYKHLLRHMAAQNDSDLDDLGIKAARKSPIDSFLERRDAARRQNQSRSEEK